MFSFAPGPTLTWALDFLVWESLGVIVRWRMLAGDYPWGRLRCVDVWMEAWLGRRWCFELPSFFLLACFD